MAEICPVCDKKVSIFNEVLVQGKPLHRGDCVDEFKLQPEKYGGKAIEAEKSRVDVCPVCEIRLNNKNEYFSVEGDIKVHTYCMDEFNLNQEFYLERIYLNPEMYDGKTEDQIQAPSNSEPSDKDFVTTLLICIFLGGLGGHRFFVDKQETAIAMLVMPIVAALIFEFLAFGLGILLFAVWGLWYLIDLLQIVTSSFEDSEGRVIAYQVAGTANTAPSTHVPEKVVEAPPAKDIPDEIRKFAELKKDGLITEEEFDKKKKELLK